MNEELLISQLEELADKLDIQVRYENVHLEEASGSGGLCRIKGQYVLIIHSQATLKEKIGMMIGAFQQFDLTDLYVKPAIRDLLETFEKNKP